MRVALYARVSTEEQVREGISIEAQVAALRAWAESEGHTISGEYVDEGVSARKSPAKRPELQRLLNDLVEKKIALVAFCKLDRWTRNVKGYYQVQDVLDCHKVAWIAIQEDYETITASGRFKVNIMLSVAENEADRTSERIKAVQGYKVEKGEAISGKVPMGYTIKDKRLVHDPEKSDAARDFFRHYMEHGSMHLTAKYMYSEYGIPIDYHMVRRMLTNTIYKGEYRGNPNYCEPLVSPDDFDAVQKMLKSRSIRMNPTGRVYVFTGLLRCSCCGRSMAAMFRKRASGLTDTYYRCNQAIQYHRCVHHKMIQESVLERWLLENIGVEADKRRESYEYEVKRKQKKKKPVDKAAVSRKLEKLKDLYLDDLIDKAQYKADREKLLADLAEAEAEPSGVDYGEIARMFSTEIPELYRAMPEQQRRDLWRSVIKEISLDENNTPLIIFR